MGDAATARRGAAGRSVALTSIPESRHFALLYDSESVKARNSSTTRMKPKAAGLPQRPARWPASSRPKSAGLISTLPW